jgi:4-amino-4-deoxy-L-arabinose transferase-like glycosyltransferase
MAGGWPARWTLALGALLSFGAAQRAWNLFRYPVDMGFDAQGNWAYVEMLLAGWRLPAPEAGWSTGHPPLFYALVAAIGGLLEDAGKDAIARSGVALCALLGLAAIAAVAVYVRRLEPRSGRRALLAAALLLFLPVHVYMSTMLSEEMLVTALVTFALVGLARELGRPEAERSDTLRPALLGLVAGLGLLTKLSAAMPIAAGAAVLLAEGPRRGWSRALRATLAFGAAVTLAGGWFYLRNLALHGYLYPYGLPAHTVMFEMPPGSRTLLDYVRFPLASFGPALATDPPLLNSVWGTTWATIWFDAHRHFLPLRAPGLETAARVLLVLGLLPAVAFAVGLARGARRALRAGSGPDRLLVGTTVLLLAGFVAFTLRNPWFPTVKGSFLLGLCAPYAIYASETLHGWMRRDRRHARMIIGAVLGILFAMSTATFSYEAIFWKEDLPGLGWGSGRP